MAQQEFDLSTATGFSTSATAISWSWSANNRPQIDAALVSGGGTAFLVTVGITVSMAPNGTMLLRTSASQTAADTLAGPDLTTDFENDGQLYLETNEFTGQIGGSEQTIAAQMATINGPNATGSEVQDDAEPYGWRPSNDDDLIAIHTALEPLNVNQNPGGRLILADTDVQLVPIAYYAPDASNLNQATGIHFAPDANTLNEVTAMYYAPDANTLNQVI